MSDIVASGYVRLNSRFFSSDRLKTNKHKLSQTEQVSYPTVLKYLSGDDIRNFSGDVLFALLVAGMGYTIEDAADLRLGDVFEFVSNGDSA